MKLFQTFAVGLLGGAFFCACSFAQNPQRGDAGALEEAQASLEEARQQLEDAAREVARLSAERVGPMMRNIVIGQDAMFTRPILGLNIEDADTGVLVAGVTPNGAADRAGVLTGDVIVEINGEDLRPDGDLRPVRRLLGQLALVDPGDTVSLGVERAGEPIRIEVETSDAGPGVFAFRDFTMPGGPNVRVFPGMRGGGFPEFDVELNGPHTIVDYPLFTRGPWRSVQLVALTPELGRYFGTDEGLLLVRAPEDESLGLIDGDVILEIGGRKPSAPEHAMRILGSFGRARAHDNAPAAPSETVDRDQGIERA